MDRHRVVAFAFVVMLGTTGSVFLQVADADDSLYVSPSGNDTNAGTQAAPFKTIEKARDVVRGINRAMTGDVVVYLGGGTYVLDAALRFDAGDSGFNGHCVVYKAVAGETPVISGGKTIAGWTKDEGGRWKARVDVADFRQLYVNGVRAVRARGRAAEGMGRYGDLQFIDGDAGHTLASEAMAGWRNQSDIEFGYYNSWGHMICKVKEIARDGAAGVKIAMQQPTFFLASRKEGVQAKDPAYIENAFELLDEPGEWYFDKLAKILYYMPRDGENLETASVVAPVLETLVELRGTPDPGSDGRRDGRPPRLGRVGAGAFARQDRPVAPGVGGTADRPPSLYVAHTPAASEGPWKSRNVSPAIWSSDWSPSVIPSRSKPLHDPNYSVKVYRTLST